MKSYLHGFISRRAWDEEWCSIALKQVKHVISAPRFCVEGAGNSGIKSIVLWIEEFFS